MLASERLVEATFILACNTLPLATEIYGIIHHAVSNMIRQAKLQAKHASFAELLFMCSC
jgi:hypothetical protein